MKKVLLIVRDGWGYAPAGKYNAVANADTPNNDEFMKKYPNTLLGAAGLDVGVPEGYQGSSEVGHLNMGAARIVKQEIVRIDEAVEDGSLFSVEIMKKAFENAKQEGRALHLMGLVQDEGVHAHQNHLFALLKHAAEVGVKNVYIHFFADGRDTPPRSSLVYLEALEEKMKEYKTGKIATVMGRYYAMDRGQKWDMTDKAFNAIVKAEGIKEADAGSAIKNSYEKDKLSDGGEMGDEY
ncbi:MAG TPA: 2,3-bisphosphoglycerate-independent phosphoglycerate mutase, partial [Firmicutes bacterium]|nr:2,3-bisphosphoglycerate-independent phosphoglycerate mutase [Bacillota bacterium]